MTRLLRASLVASTLVAAAGWQNSPATSRFTVRAIDPILEAGSPDGRWAIYRKEDTPRTVWLRDLTTRRDRELVTFGGDIWATAWSVDSDSLAFSVGDWEVHVVGITDGTDRILPTRGRVLGWTTGRDVAIQGLGSDSPGLVLARPSGAGQRIVFASTSPTPDWPSTITPDGRTLVVQGRDRLVLRDIEVGMDRELVRLPGVKGPVVSPDSRLVAFVAGRALYVAPLDAAPVRNPVKVLEPLGELDVSQGGKPSMWWTSDGRLVVPNVVNSTENLYRIDMDPKTGRPRGSIRLLLRNADFPAISPDGKTIAHTRFSGLALGLLDVAKGANRELLVGSSVAGQMFGWRSPTVVVLSGQGNISTIDLKTESQATHFSDKGVYTYSPARDEVLLHFQPTQTAPKVLKTRSLATGEERTIATIERLSEYRVSNDGRYVAYGRRIGQGPDAPGELRIVGTDGQGDRLILSTKVGCDPVVWSPDGRWLLYIDWSDDNRIRVVDVTTSETWFLSEAPSQPHWWGGDAQGSWAPDGTFVVVGAESAWKDPVGKVFEGVTYDAVAKLRAGVADAGIDEVSGFAFPVRASAGLDRQASEIATRVERAYGHLKQLLGLAPTVALEVLAEKDWPAGPVFGMPHFQDHTIVVAGKPRNWRSIVPLIAAQSPGAIGRLKDIYGPELDVSRFFRLLAVHELGHAFQAEAHQTFPRPWVNEFYADLALHSYIAGAEPELLPVLRTFPRAFAGVQMPHRILADFGTPGAGARQAPENYAWYQAQFHVFADRVYAKARDSALVYLTRTAFPSVTTDAEFAALLRSGPHPELAEVIDAWPATAVRSGAVR